MSAVDTSDTCSTRQMIISPTLDCKHFLWIKLLFAFVFIPFVTAKLNLNTRWEWLSSPTESYEALTDNLESWFFMRPNFDPLEEEKGTYYSSWERLDCVLDQCPNVEETKAQFLTSFFSAWHISAPAYLLYFFFTADSLSSSYCLTHSVTQ